MQFAARSDVQAPIEWVFGQISDFPAFERQAMRRGADLRRLTADAKPGLGMAWDVKFQFRGKERNVKAEVVAFDPPAGLAILGTSPNLGGRMTVDLMALARSTTRMTVRLDIEAHSLSARLLLQSLKLARGTLTRRFETSISGYAIELQDRYLRQAR